jgi:hypothetical protein
MVVLDVFSLLPNALSVHAERSTGILQINFGVIQNKSKIGNYSNNNYLFIFTTESYLVLPFKKFVWSSTSHTDLTWTIHLLLTLRIHTSYIIAGFC